MSWNAIWTNTAPWDSTGVYASANAEMIYAKLYSELGWSYNATIACIANLTAESYLNPKQWQLNSDYPNWETDSSVGFGLGQWTPAYKVYSYCGSTDEDTVGDGDMQLEMLDAQNTQWRTTLVNSDGSSTYYGLSSGSLAYYTSFSAFKQGTDDIDKMTLSYACCWERPNTAYLYASKRISYAEHWDNYFSGSTTLRIYLYTSGNGTADVSNSTPEAGETVTLTCTPYDDDTLEDIVAYTVTSGESVAFSVTEVQDFTMPSESIIINVYFTGDSPTPPTPTTKKKMPLYMMVRRRTIL